MVIFDNILRIHSFEGLEYDDFQSPLNMFLLRQITAVSLAIRHGKCAVV